MLLHDKLPHRLRTEVVGPRCWCEYPDANFWTVQPEARHNKDSRHRQKVLGNSQGLLHDLISTAAKITWQPPEQTEHGRASRQAGPGTLLLVIRPRQEARPSA